MPEKNFRVEHALAFFKALNMTTEAGIADTFKLDIGPELIHTLCGYAEGTFKVYTGENAGPAMDVANALILIGYALRVSEEREVANFSEALAPTGTLRH